MESHVAFSHDASNVVICQNSDELLSLEGSKPSKSLDEKEADDTDVASLSFGLNELINRIEREEEYIPKHEVESSTCVDERLSEYYTDHCESVTPYIDNDKSTESSLTKAESISKRNLSYSYYRYNYLNRLMARYSNNISNSKIEIGYFWSKALPVCVSSFLDLYSVTNLRQVCKSLYNKPQYSINSCEFQGICTLTENEFITKVFPQLRNFLTTKSFSQLNFSRCCLLTDTFPQSVVGFQNGFLCSQLRSLLFDFCYALTDKSLETLLLTHLPNLEILSLRCARSRDLTGAPFSSKALLSKERWPKFHQLSCSCTQINLIHLDSVSFFLTERAIELNVSPKLGISGSLASKSLIRRLQLEEYHENFINHVISGAGVDELDKCVIEFGKKWVQKMNLEENQRKVLHRLVFNRASTILVNAPCSVPIIDDTDNYVKDNYSSFSNKNNDLEKKFSASIQEKNHLSSMHSDASSNLDGKYMEFNCSRCNCVLDPTQRKNPFYSHFSKSENDTNSINPSQNSNYVKWSYPLPIAIRLGNISVVEYLLEKGAYVDVWGYNFATPLYIAVSNVKDYSLVESDSDEFLDRSAMSNQSANDKTKDICIENTPSLSIPIAPFVFRNDDKNVDSLYSESESGIPQCNITSLTNFDIDNKIQDTNLVWSSNDQPLQSKLISTLNDLLPNSVNLSTSLEMTKNPNGLTPNSTLVETTHKELVTKNCSKIIASTSSCKDLTSRSSSDIYSDNVLNRCRCPCHYALRKIKDGKKKAVSIVKLLLKWGAQVDSPDLYSIKCPVNAAIKYDNKELLNILIKNGARINVRSVPPDSITPILEISRRHQKKKNTPSSLTRLSYKSPLFVACELSAWNCVELLLYCGADPNWTDPFSKRHLTPTLLAYRKNPKMLEMFIDRGAGYSEDSRWILSEVLAAAIIQDDIGTIRFLIRQYPDLMYRESTGMWSLPIIQASRLNKLDVVLELLNLGNDPNALDSDSFTSLHSACSEGHIVIIEALLLRGANPNIKGGAQLKTPLHIAVEENHKEAVKILLKNGSDINSRDFKGLTPLMTAIISRNDKVALLIIKETNDVKLLDTTDLSNKTALNYAVYFGQFNVAYALVEKGVLCCISDTSGSTPDSILKEKIQSLSQTAPLSGFNKFLRNLINATIGSNQGSNAFRLKSFDPTKRFRNQSTSPPSSNTDDQNDFSENSLRKLNAKRKKIAKRLLNKIRSKAKEDLKKKPN